MKRAPIVLVLACTVVVAAAAEERRPPVADQPAGDTHTAPPCQIDERLSLWLSLEAADRTISALERERRELAVDREKLRKQLELLNGGTTTREEGELGDAVAKINAQVAGEGPLNEAYTQIDTRIVEIDRTLKRRRRLRALAEDELEALLSPPGESR